MKKTVTEVSFGEYKESDKSVTLRNSSASIGGGRKFSSSWTLGVDLHNHVITGEKTMTITGSRADEHHIPCVIIRGGVGH